MGTSIVGYDAITSNVSHLPAGLHLGYTTGRGIAWSAAQWAADPGAVHLCQDYGLTDDTADGFDVESGAGTPAQVPDAVRRARAAFLARKRPGQRWPIVYSQGSLIAPICDYLARAGLSDVPLFVARPGMGASTARAIVTAAGGPYPTLAVQYAWPNYGLPSNAAYDASVYDTGWLARQSGVAGDTVRQGSSGPAVHALQALLSAFGHPQIAADGLFGPATDAAVRGFQGLMGLKQDGVAGPATWAALENNSPKPPHGAPITAPEPVSVTNKGSMVSWAWSPVGGADFYQLRVFGTLGSKVWFGQTHSHGLTVGIYHHQTIRWQVQAGNDKGWGPMGALHSFNLK